MEDNNFLWGVYFTCLAGIYGAFIAKILYLSKKYQELPKDNISKNFSYDLKVLSCSLDDDFTKSFNKYDYLYKMKNKDVCVVMKDFVNTMSMLSILKNTLFNNSENKLYCLYIEDYSCDVDMEFLRNLCDENDITLVSNELEFNDFKKVYRSFYDEHNIGVLVETDSVVNICNNIMDNILSGNNFINTQYEYDNFSDNIEIFRPFYNIKLTQINKYYDTHLDYPNTFFEDNFEHNSDEINFYDMIENTNMYTDWENKLFNIYRIQKGFMRELDTKLDLLKEQCQKYKNGFIFNLPNKFIPFQIWNNLFQSFCKDYNIEVVQNKDKTVYFDIMNNDLTYGNLDEIDEWMYFFENNMLIVYNNKRCQNMIDNLSININSNDDDVFESEDIEENSVSKFLNEEHFYYQIMPFTNSTSNYLTVDDIDVTSANFSEEFASMFKYKNNGVNSLFKLE